MQADSREVNRGQVGAAVARELLADTIDFVGDVFRSLPSSGCIEFQSEVTLRSAGIVTRGWPTLYLGTMSLIQNRESQ